MKGQGRFALIVLVSLLSCALTSCSKPKTTDQAKAQSPAPSPAAEVKSDVCNLLTSEEIQALQGEAFKDTKPSQKTAAGLSVAQCYFELPTASNSVVLTVTRKAEGGRDPSASWKDMFHSEKLREKKEEGEEEKGPLKVEGVGEEAFWTGTRVGGALYVLKGNVYIRISVGGPGDQNAKMEKSKTLAEKVVGRL